MTTDHGHFRVWHKADMPTVYGDVGLREGKEVGALANFDALNDDELERTVVASARWV
jgi:hypothetical protein